MITVHTTNRMHLICWMGTRNGRLKNSFNPGGTLPTHLDTSKKWTCDIKGYLIWPKIKLCTTHLYIINKLFLVYLTHPLEVLSYSSSCLTVCVSVCVCFVIKLLCN